MGILDADYEGRPAFGIVFQRGERETWGVKLQQLEYSEYEARLWMEANYVLSFYYGQTANVGNYNPENIVAKLIPLFLLEADTGKIARRFRQWKKKWKDAEELTQELVKTDGLTKKELSGATKFIKTNAQFFIEKEKSLVETAHRLQRRSP